MATEQPSKTQDSITFASLCLKHPIMVIQKTKPLSAIYFLETNRVIEDKDIYDFESRKKDKRGRFEKK